MWAWALQQAFARYQPPDTDWHDESVFFSHFLVDDQVLVEPALGVRRFVAGRLADHLARTLLGQDAINDVKNAVEGAWEETKSCWGLLYNTRTLTVTLP